MVRKLIDENSSITMSQVDYQRKYDALEVNFNDKKQKLEMLQTKQADFKSCEIAMRIFIKEFEKAPIAITEWSESSWNLCVLKAVVDRKGKINFKNKYCLFTFVV